VEVAIKIRKILQIILSPKVRAPGVKGWELKRTVGKDYHTIVQAAKSELDKLGLTIRTVGEQGDLTTEATPEQLDEARYYVIFKESLSIKEATSSGMSIDDLAALAVTLSYLTSKRGKAPLREVEKMLREKLPKWKVEWNLRRFVRKGYIVKGEDDMIAIGWRSLVEVDLKSLLTLLLTSPIKEVSQ